MSISNQTVQETYLGDGSQVNFAIPFDYFVNSQVFVRTRNTVTDATVILTQGVEFTVVAPNVVFGSAPSTTEEVTVYRSTPITQEVDYIETGAFLAEDHEKGMDRMVMMIQEIADAVANISVTAGAGAGALTRLVAQVVTAAGTVSIGTNQRMVKVISGSSGGVTADTTTPIDDGTIDGQELRLVGLSDSDTLTMLASGNINLNGPIVFYQNTILDLFWDETNTKWVESSRRA